MSNTEQKECWSIDGEEFNHDSLGDLLDDRGDEVRPGHKVWRGTAKRPSMADFVDADSVIEDIAAQACDFGGEYADGYPEVSPEHKAKLQAMLEQWLAECPSPRFYQVTNAMPYVLADTDFTQEQLAEIAAQEEDDNTEPQKGDHVWQLDVDNEPDGVFYDPLIHKHRFEAGEIYATREQAQAAAKAKQGG